MARLPVVIGAAALMLNATPLSLAFTSSFVSYGRSTISTPNVNLASIHIQSRVAAKMTARDGGGEEAEPAAAAAGGGGGGAGAVSRGGFFASLATAALGSGAVLLGATLTAPDEASANGMLDYPPARLNNRYFLMRSGEGGSDKEGLIQSHPIDKLHMDNRLTDQGVEEAQRAAGVLRALGVTDAFIWADISSRAQDTARILAQELEIRQDRIVPEYSFLEPRGMGIFDGKEASAVLPDVYKEDANDLTWRPPPNTDGTPNESVNDVFVRIRQLMSKLETQYQGEDLVIIAADSDCLSVMQSFALGEELGKHSKYYLRPGEGRQLRTSVDTEVGYRTRRLAKGGTVAAPESDGGWSKGVEVAAAGAGGPSVSSTAVLAPPAS